MAIHDSSKPLYIQIKESVKKDILSHKYPSDGKLPSEKALCEEFKVSRITIRQALRLLENEGMIYTVHGKGTFAKGSVIDSNLQKISSFGDTLAQMGYKGCTKILHYEEREADDFEGMLRGRDWKRVSHLSLTGYAMEEPVVLYHSVIRGVYGPLMHKAAMEMEKRGVPFSTFDLYEQIGLEIGKIDQKIAAINADKKIAEILQLNEGDAILVLDSVILDENMQPIEYKKGYYCTDKYTFNLHREL